MIFGKLMALNGVDFTLNRGDILGMIGPNGSGKTTLFNTISGIYAPASGIVFFKGQSLQKKQPHKVCRMGIARTFQIVQPFTKMTLLQNVATGAMQGAGLSFNEGFEKAEQVLAFVGLGEKVDYEPDNITTAERRRLELARALATDPEIILLDEIMAGLTPTEIETVLELLKEINDSGVTIFMVEHIMRAVMSVCNRIIVLNHGVLIAEGRPQEIAENQEVITAYLGDRYA